MSGKTLQYETKPKRRMHRRGIMAVLGCIVAFATASALMVPAIAATEDELGGFSVVAASADPLFQAVNDSGTPENEPSQAADTPDEDTSPSVEEQETESAEAAPPSSVDGASSVSATEATAKMPAVEFEEVVERHNAPAIKVKVKAPEGAFPEGTTMHAELVASDTVQDKVQEAIERENGEDIVIKEITAVDIVFKDADGTEIEPAVKVEVKITSDDVRDFENPVLVHVLDKGKSSSKGAVNDAEVVGKVKIVNEDDDDVTEGAEDTMKFESEAFSPYVIVEYELVEGTSEHVFTASDGTDYRIVVTCPSDAAIPENAKLTVAEIAQGGSAYGATYDEYVANAESALGLDEGSTVGVRLFDIKIVDKDDPSIKYQPAEGAAVDVRIELDGAVDDSYNVVHFAEGENAGDAIEGVAAEDGAVSFATGGFSVYAIVPGPEPVPLGWQKVTSLEDLETHGTTGVYVGHVDGYYFKNNLVSDGSRTGIRKTKPPSISPSSSAAMYYFEKVEGSDNQFYAYCYDADDEKQYVYNGGDNSLSFTTEENKTAFTVAVDADGKFTFGNAGWYWNMQSGASGNRFCSWNSSTDPNSKMCVWYKEPIDQDPYGLNGQSKTLLVWDGGQTGKAMTSTANETYSDNLGAEFLTVMVKEGNANDRLYVPNDTSANVTSWTFEWQEIDLYHLSADVDGVKKYLSIDGDGLHMVDEPSKIQVVPGTGIHAGQICLKSTNGATLTYSGKFDEGFNVGGDPGSEWLYLADPKDESILEGYTRTYSATKVSISDHSHDGVYDELHDPYAKQDHGYVIYTRVWNGHGYSYFALNGEGRLVPCVESGDSIEWIGGSINDMVWWFTEYTNSAGEPTNYYELYNQSANGGNGAFLAPLVSDEQILSDDPIGLLLPGRTNGQYYSPILTWDGDSYTYAGLKVDLDKPDPLLEACIRSESLVFYLATMEDLPKDNDLSTVKTVDNDQYGITMKLIDFNSRQDMSDFLGNDEGGTTTKTVPDLLSTNLDGKGESAYPTVTANGNRMADFFNGSKVVNRLFLESTYRTTGYYEFDSAQNFASLKGATSGDFTVYKELGTTDVVDRNTAKHGQFFPYNDIQAGLFSEKNPRNLYSADAKPLPESDPRKYEQLYKTKEDTDYFFGMELSASFIQTPSGLDAWGHDIIFEFSGDDDFWLYVDGELVIDLGGIHSAIPGSVNFRTGKVNVNGRDTSLRELFIENYVKRGMTPAAAEEKANGLFVRNDEGNYVFADDTQHTMRIFYLERGAGASNLHMRFNLASVKKGTVQLSKKLEVEDGSAPESELVAYPYQIWYKDAQGEEKQLTNKPDTYVVYKDSVNPVAYKETLTVTKDVDGGARQVTYDDVFLLKPGETAEISFPTYGEQQLPVQDYWIVECGIDQDVYSTVKANDVEITGVPTYPPCLYDYPIDSASTDSRPRVTYENTAKETKSMTIEKELYDKVTGEKIELYDENGNAIDPTNPDLQRTFDFRLYFKTAYDEDFVAANMYPYHVKDPAGYYCRWDKGTQRFVKIGQGVTNFDDLTDKEKVQATFDTSTNGSISQIPAYYTVEARGLIPGTQFKVIERPTETPDGYKYYKYELNGEDQHVTDPWDGVTGTIESGAEAKSDITVCNYKGYGLRVNKVWADADTTVYRDPTYFAVFYEIDKTNLKLVDDSVRKLQFGDDPQTLYWYYQDLPPIEGVADIDFNKYVVREVTFDGSSVTPIADGGRVSLHALTSEGTEQLVAYKVTYDNPTQVGDNVNIYYTTNTPDDRPAIKLLKEDWANNPLAGAEFTLKSKESGAVIGTYTSSSTGLIHIAYLDYGKTYTLTESSSPQGYIGLPQSLEITMPNDASGEVTVRAEFGNNVSDYYELTQKTAEEPATLVIKDRPYVFQVIKVDFVNPSTKVAGAKFQLFKQIEVGTEHRWDTNPMTWGGVSILVSDENGVIPHLDKDLPAGTYQLREVEAPNGYKQLDKHTEFTVSPTGVITLRENHAEGVTLEKNESGTETTYTMTLPNVPNKVLPTMGGTGTMIFTVVGLALIVIAASVLAYNIRRKRDA